MILVVLYRSSALYIAIGQCGSTGQGDVSPYKWGHAWSTELHNVLLVNMEIQLDSLVAPIAVRASTIRTQPLQWRLIAWIVKLGTLPQSQMRLALQIAVYVISVTLAQALRRH